MSSISDGYQVTVGDFQMSMLVIVSWRITQAGRHRSCNRHMILPLRHEQPLAQIGSRLAKVILPLMNTFSFIVSPLGCFTSQAHNWSHMKFNSLLFTWCNTVLVQLLVSQILINHCNSPAHHGTPLQTGGSGGIVPWM